MSVTISNKIFSSFGNKRFINFNLVVGAYTTNGVALTAATLGLSSIDLLLAEYRSGVMYVYDHTNAKILAYRQKIGSTGALSKPAITSTDGTATVVGGAAAGAALYFSPDNASGMMAVSGVTGPITIPAATFGITPVSMALATAVTFTGDTNAAAVFAQVANAATLSDTVRCIVIGV